MALPVTPNNGSANPTATVRPRHAGPRPCPSCRSCAHRSATSAGDRMVRADTTRVAAPSTAAVRVATAPAPPGAPSAGGSAFVPWPARGWRAARCPARPLARGGWRRPAPAGLALRRPEAGSDRRGHTEASGRHRRATRPDTAGTSQGACPAPRIHVIQAVGGADHGGSKQQVGTPLRCICNRARPTCLASGFSGVRHRHGMVPKP